MNPNYEKARTHLTAGRPEIAAPILRKFLKAHRKNGPAINSLARCEIEMGNPDEAEKILKRTLRLEPSNPYARMKLAQLQLMRGNYGAKVWQDYDLFWTPCPGSSYKPPSYPWPRWNGEDLTGKMILIEGEMGYGDIIQFSRFVPSLVDMGARVLLTCPENLAPVLHSLDGLERLILPGEEIGDCDYWCPVMRLPVVFQKMPDAPCKAPHLKAPSIDFTLPEGQGSKIGICWHSRTVAGAKKSLTLEDVRPLLESESHTLASRNRTFYSLNVPAPENLPEHVIDLAPMLTDFGATAAAIQQLDMVISIDSAVAHLTAALGKVPWVLLP